MNLIPTVGRIVHYKGQKNGVVKNYPAMVIDVDTSEEGSTKVLLGVHTESGYQTLSWIDKQGEEMGSWDWMPFQKDQQARLETTDKVG